MKKQTLLFFLMLMPLMASAYDVEIDGIYYNLNQKTRQAEVTNGGTYDQFTGEIVIPQNVENESISYSVTSIGSYAFFNCSNLTSIEIPNSVTSIGNGAFEYCSGLTSVTIPNSVTFIGSSAFEGCSSLPVVDNCRYADTYLIEVIDETIATCTIKVGTRLIGDYAFFNCSNLTSIEIPNSVTSIGYGAFRNCSGLTSIEIPNSVASIGNYAFYNCSSLTSIEIPNSVASIGNYAFSGCKSLTSVTIPNNVTSIGDCAFYGCSSLISIRVDEGNSVFDSRENCNAIVLTENNELIVGCKSTIIPNSVTRLGIAHSEVVVN